MSEKEIRQAQENIISAMNSIEYCKEKALFSNNFMALIYELKTQVESIYKDMKNTVLELNEKGEDFENFSVVTQNRFDKYLHSDKIKDTLKLLGYEKKDYISEEIKSPKELQKHIADTHFEEIKKYIHYKEVQTVKYKK